jgi:hypothetical protein
MLSLAPAARIAGLIGFTAKPGSFCLFCDNSWSLLPTVTSVDPPGVIGAAWASAGRSSAANAAATVVATLILRMTLLGWSIYGQISPAATHDTCLPRSSA